VTYTAEVLQLPKIFQKKEELVLSDHSFRGVLLTASTSMGFETAFNGVASIYLDDDRGNDTSPFFPEDLGILYDRARDSADIERAIQMFSKNFCNERFLHTFFNRLEALAGTLSEPSACDYQNFIRNGLAGSAQPYFLNSTKLP